MRISKAAQYHDATNTILPQKSENVRPHSSNSFENATSLIVNPVGKMRPHPKIPTACEKNLWYPGYRKECASEFKTLTDYVIPRNKSQKSK